MSSGDNNTAEFKTDKLNIALFCGSLVLLYFSSNYSYLLFHSLAEIYSICIAFTIFLISWNAREYLKSDYLLFIGISYLFIGFLDLLHTLSFKGMKIFTDYDYYANQLWIATRFKESVAFLVAFVLLITKRKINPFYTMLMFMGLSTLVVLSIFTWKIFPVCFIEGIGLTTFKIYSEYVICAILLLDIIILKRYRGLFDKEVFYLLLWSLLATIFSELAFTFYITNYDLSNLVGHYFKIISFYLIYKAIIEKAVRTPYQLIFRELKDKEQMLEMQNNLLKDQTRKDSLTSLLNHGAVFEQLEKEIERAKRYNCSLCAIMFDIDLFKNVNDRFGHAFGDVVIKRVAKTITDNIRTVDTAARYGGEEFLVLLPEIDAAAGQLVAERIRRSVSELELPEGLRISVSGGMAVYYGEEPVEFVNRADMNLYAAKLNGRNRIAV